VTVLRGGGGGGVLFGDLGQHILIWIEAFEGEPQLIFLLRFSLPLIPVPGTMVLVLVLFFNYNMVLKKTLKT
jgi:hypothetical protein